MIDRALDAVVATITVAASGGGIAVTPDGARVYVASGAISVIDTLTNTVVDSFFCGSRRASTGVAMSPDGSRAYFLTNGLDIFGSGGGVVVLDTATNTVIRTIVLGVLPGQIALAPDGSRAYVGIQAVWVNTGYGAAFIPGRSVTVIDTTLNASDRFDRPRRRRRAAGPCRTPPRESPSRRTEATSTSRFRASVRSR